MADRTHFIADSELICDSKKNAFHKCQQYHEKDNTLHYCPHFYAEVPKWYIGDQEPLMEVEGYCSLLNRRR